ncbi:Endoribonuclease Dicer-like protein 3a [Nymphaea thermarum]|nr:Endoribonuclease Dicer-like protein 3a [Nymphaea thermarum]
MAEERNSLPPPPPPPSMPLGNDSLGTVAVLPIAADIQSAVASTGSKWSLIKQWYKALDPQLMPYACNNGGTAYDLEFTMDHKLVVVSNGDLLYQVLNYVTSMLEIPTEELTETSYSNALRLFSYPGVSSAEDCEYQISELEELLDSKVFNLEDRNDLEVHVPMAIEIKRYYSSWFVNVDLKGELDSLWTKTPIWGMVWANAHSRWSKPPPKGRFNTKIGARAGSAPQRVCTGPRLAVRTTLSHGSAPGAVVGLVV